MVLLCVYGLANRFRASIPVVFQVAALLAALTHPGHIVIYAPGDSFLAAALHLEIQWVYIYIRCLSGYSFVSYAVIRNLLDIH
ncbi:hypothetical protein SAMN05421784_11751 [Xenorhabdus koppenhoeferi]|uniref:Uncharacterized protein n=1 Tax=Xenorhabdus koppenhoeferi TaxID=351659 RepID=A0A1I7I105_9GAMM|nr:hypothetical protein SAMN05421784_11751 [Xenorhabdus koppenhoeferi]